MSHNRNHGFITSLIGNCALAVLTTAVQPARPTNVLNRTPSRGIEISKEEYVYVRYAEAIEGIEVDYWPTNDHPMRLRQVAPLLFQSTNGDERLSFRRSKDNQRIYLIDYNFRGDGAFRRISSSDRTIP